MQHEEKKITTDCNTRSQRSRGHHLARRIVVFDVVFADSPIRIISLLEFNKAATAGDGRTLPRWMDVSVVPGGLASCRKAFFF